VAHPPLAYRCARSTTRDEEGDVHPFLQRLATEEDGHLVVGVTGLLGAAGAIVLAVGATIDIDVLVWAGAVVVAAGSINGTFREHTQVTYSILDRLDRLEGGSSED
jgi:hypothetical protein